MQQMLMGEGKTTAIAPLLSLCLADGRRLVMQIVPDPLLAQTRHVLWNCFTVIATNLVAKNMGGPF